MKKCVPAEVHGVNGQIGTANIWYDTQGFWKPGHTHFMCPVCGEVWGKVLVNSIYRARHGALITPCQEHGGGVYHSRIALSDIERFQVDWSREVLEHDFVVMFDWVEGLRQPEQYGDSYGDDTMTVSCTQWKDKVG